MSLATIFVFAAVAAGQPAPQADTRADTQANLVEVDTERTPMRCKPAPYYVADRGGEQARVGRVFVTGSRVPVSARDLAERRTRPCFLMRDPDMLRGIDTPPNPFRTAD
jgi:hypothetical protein